MKKSLLLIVFLNICLVREFVYVDACFGTIKHHVHVLSKLPPNSLPLRIHCASGDDDLGFRNLSPNQDYEWHFCGTYVPTTIFFCHFWWDVTPNQKLYQAFEVYHQKIVATQTHESWWIIKSDGIHYTDDQLFVDLAPNKFDWLVTRPTT